MTDNAERLDRTAFYKAALHRSYQPTKDDMALDVSVPASSERLAQAALKGGAPRRQEA